MGSIKDTTLGEFVNLSYIDLQLKFIEKIVDQEDVTLEDLVKSCIDKYKEEEKSSEISAQDKDILNTLRKCQSG